MCKPAVFLSRLEFTVLLMSMGVERIQCFSLPEADGVDRKGMTEAVHQLVLKGFLQIEENGLRLSAELEEMIGCIKNCTDYLFIEPGNDTLPQRIVYRGRQAAILENIANTNHEFRLFVMEAEKLWTWLEEVFDIPDTDIESKAEAWELVNLSGLAEQEFRELQKQMYSDRNWWKSFCNMSYVSVRFFNSQETINAAKELILFPGTINLWFLWRHKDTFEIIPDSIEIREELKNLLGREEK